MIRDQREESSWGTNLGGQEVINTRLSPSLFPPHLCEVTTRLQLLPPLTLSYVLFLTASRSHTGGGSVLKPTPWCSVGGRPTTDRSGTRDQILKRPVNSAAGCSLWMTRNAAHDFAAMTGSRGLAVVDEAISGWPCG